MLTAGPYTGVRARRGRGAVAAATVGLVLAMSPYGIVRAQAAAAAVGDSRGNTSAPPGFELSTVATALQIDAASTDVVHVSSTLPIEAAVEAWSRWWGAGAVPLRESRVAGWRVLSRPGSAGLVTVQLRAAPAGGSEGYLALRRAAPAGSPVRDAAVPFGLPAGARVLRTVAAADVGRTGTQTVIAVQGTARGALKSFARSARATGWAPIPLPILVHASVWPRSLDAPRTLWLQRGAEELGLFATDAGSNALVVVHHVGAAPSSQGRR